MQKYVSIIFFGVLLQISFPALASVDAAIVARAETYLNQDLKSARGDFTQTTNVDDKIQKGTFLMARPGRIKLNYEEEGKTYLELTSNGREIISYDKKADQVAHIPLDLTPAGIILRDSVKLQGADIEARSTTVKDDTIEVVLGLSQDPGAGSMTLVFDKEPFSLVKWQVLDPQGTETTVALQNMVFGVSTQKSDFKSSKPVKVYGSEGERAL